MMIPVASFRFGYFIKSGLVGTFIRFSEFEPEASRNLDHRLPTVICKAGALPLSYEPT